MVGVAIRADGYVETMNDMATLAIVLSIILSVLGVIVTLWILWAVIRGAVLSALRQHRREAPSFDIDPM